MTETRLSLEDWLDDLCVRFIINLPREELESVERICFQVEEAQWFYEDFIRPLDPALPSLSLKAFAMCIFQHCPLMSQWSEYHHTTAFAEFLAYKTRVPVRGAIMLNETMDKVVLVKGWKKNANWSFPRGKINKEEKDLDCAVREVLEETGYDLREAGLVKDEKEMKFIEITMREQHMKLYVFRGVPMDTQFAPQTRKEISRIEWVNLSDLPTVKKNKTAQNDAINANKFYMVAPFLHPLKKWIAQQRKLDAKNHPAVSSLAYTEGETSMDEGFVSVNNGFAPSRPHIQPGTASDLPELNHSQDASSHLKRLLNIGPSASDMKPSTPVSATDTSKSNALLSLLRAGSSDTTSQGRSEPMAGLPGGFTHYPGSTQQPVYHHLPGTFNQQTPFSGPMESDRSTSYLPYQQVSYSSAPNGPVKPSQSFNVPTQHATQLPASNWHPPFSEQRPPVPDNRVHQPSNTQQAAPVPTRPQPAVAPYQQTGDPQFAKQTNATAFQGSTIPPASKLPPPKLNSHSLALLNVFKTSSPTPKVAPISQRGAQNSMPPKPPQQDNLLALFKSPAHKPSSMPAAELAAQPVQSAPIQILQRPASSKKETPKVKADDVENGALTSATVSGPLKTPEFGQKGIVQQETSQPKTNKKTQDPASPITILPRPSVVKRDSSVSSEQISRPSSRSHVDKTKATDTSKSFQPQILRRSDKLDLNNVLPTRTIPVSQLSDSPSPYSPVSKPLAVKQDKPVLPIYDRRPSQTAAQKEALLNLFGKSPSDKPSHLSSITDRPASRGHYDAVSSPSLSGVESNVPANVSKLENPSEKSTTNTGAQRLTSPDNKAFLLGFLQNVAQGKK